MSRKEKLRVRFFGTPAPKDFSWAELLRLMQGYGFEEKTGDGSRRRFYDPAKSEVPFLSMHKRHPDDTLLGYQVKDVKEFLREGGYEK